MNKIPTKKLTALLLTAIMLICALPLGIAAEDTAGQGNLHENPNIAEAPAELEYTDNSGIIMGDVNGDKVVDSFDYTLVKRAAIGLIGLAGGQFKAADVNGDKTIDSFDYLLIKRAVIFGTTIEPPAPTDSEGLEYTLNEDGASYSVTGIGTCRDNVIRIPAVYNNMPVTEIGDRAFYDCGSLTEVVIPGSVTSIGSTAFGCCTGLTEITIPDSVTHIGDHAFAACTGLTEVTIPDSVNAINEWTFTECTNLTRVIIPDSVTYIAHFAFSKCGNLTEITIPDSVTSISASVFSDCTGLTKVTIPGSVTSIGDLAFAYCGSLTEVVIPDSVASIGINAFRSCTALTEIVIPASVASVGEWAFRGCSSLTIKCEAASKPDGWDNVWNPDNRPVVWGYQKSEFSEGLEYTLNSDNASYSVTGIGTCKDAVIRIPDTYNGLPVTEIGGSAFSWHFGITEVIMPDSIKHIGAGAFSWCSDIRSTVISASLESIGVGAFSYCGNLMQISGGSDNFKVEGNCIIDAATGTLVVGCGSSVIPEYVTAIGNYAFEGCSGLTSLNVPDSVTKIMQYAFENCTALTEVTLPESLEAIGDFAFSGCSGLAQIIIPASVSVVGNSAFRGCESLSIKCKAASKPDGWHSNWNPAGRPVTWGFITSLGGD